jgi:hypothetical protein
MEKTSQQWFSEAIRKGEIAVDRTINDDLSNNMPILLQARGYLRGMSCTHWRESEMMDALARMEADVQLAHQQLAV